jgi:adenylate cyclase
MPAHDLPLPLPGTIVPGATTRFLLGEARASATPADLLRGYAEALRADGAPVDRLFLLMPTLHPEVRALNVIWNIDDGDVREVARAWSGVLTKEFQESPLAAIVAGSHTVIRRALHDPSTPRDYGILRELDQGGFTDYVVAGIPPVARAAAHAALSWSTRAPGGFSPDATALCLASLALLTPLLDTHVARLIARSVMKVYLGADAGGRVLDGSVRRGDGESIRAAVSFTDLRDFTALSDRLSRDELLELLNAYFDCVVDAAEANGGEVLKFIGDAVLTIYRAEAAGEREAGLAALAGARAAFARAVVANESRGGLTKIDFGTSIHVGEVMYGNIGSAARLDFTVIGPAVNLASRIQGLCRSVGRPLLVSEAFVAATGADCDDLGVRALKGVARDVRIFSPR